MSESGGVDEVGADGVDDEGRILEVECSGYVRVG